MVNISVLFTVIIKYKTDRKYKHPTLTEEQIDRDIRTINSSMRGAKRGKTYNKHTGK